jgi:hypothetical protein
MVPTYSAVFSASAIFISALASAQLAMSSLALAQTPNPNPTNANPIPMRFEWVREGPADKCANQCREWISASGAIVENTLHDFEAFARTRDVRRATIILDSPGGNVVQGLALGKEFRRLEITTSVGNAIKISPAVGEQKVALSSRATCSSMCVFLLLGGVQRHVPDEARILVHQIWPSNKRNDANAATYSAGNVVAIQRVNGEISRYIVDMGVDIELFELASRIPPWEEMRRLTRDELRRTKVHTVDDPFSRPPAAAVASTSPNRKPESAATATNVNTLGWTIVDRKGQRALVRMHPITIEGQEIGAFEISFTCSNKPDTYQVAYLEKRIIPNSTLVVSDRLEAVGISIRHENSFLRTLLTLEESIPGKAPAELLSRARGTISASHLETAAITSSLETIASSSQQGLVVATTTVDKVRTVIRLGHTGLPEGLKQLSSTCDDAFPN